MRPGPSTRAATRALGHLEHGRTIAQAADLTTLTPAAVRRLGQAVGMVEHPDGTMRYTPPSGPPRPPAGRAMGGRQRAAAADYPTASVRAWARLNGIPCPDLGRYLPNEVVAQWRAAGAPE